MTSVRLSNDCIRIGRQKKGANASGEGVGEKPDVCVDATGKKHGIRCENAVENLVWQFSARGGDSHGA